MTLARKEAAWKKKKQEIMKRNETEMAEDRREEAREAKKRRTAAAGAVKAASRGRKVRHRLQKTSVDEEMKDTDGEVWTDGEVSFRLRPEEAAEAHDTGGRRERSHSEEASEARKSKESG